MIFDLKMASVISSVGRTKASSFSFWFSLRRARKPSTFFGRSFSWAMLINVCDEETTNIWHPPEEKFRRSRKYSDVTIKVDNTSFKLHRFVLSLKSDYFEKLFAENFMECDMREVEINVVEKRVFADFIKLLYGRSTKLIATPSNFGSLFMAMDYFQTRTLLADFESFLNYEDSFINRAPASNTEMNEIIEQYNMVKSHPRYKNSVIFPQMTTYFSKYLQELSNTEKFLSLSLPEVKGILEVERSCGLAVEQIEDICVKWICHDVTGRLDSIVTLANAIEHGGRNFLYVKMDDERLKHIKPPPLDNEDQTREWVKRCFHRLRLCDGVLDPSPWRQYLPDDGASGDKGTSPDDGVPGYEEDCLSHCTTERTELKKFNTFLNNESFYDVVIKIGEEKFRLHRIVLVNASEYFDALFLPSSNSSEIHEVQLPDDIDAATFHIVVRHIYKFEIDFTSETDFISLFRAINLFQLQDLFETCEKYILTNWQKIDKKMDIIATIKKYFGGLSWQMRNDVFETCSDIEKITNFYDLCTLELWDEISAFYKVTSEDKIIDMCVKWISHDKPNRYHQLSELAAIVTRISNSKCHQHENVDFNNFNDTEIKRKFLEILNDQKIIPSVTSDLSPVTENRPFFFIIDKEKLCFRFVNARFEDIDSLLPLHLNPTSLQTRMQEAGHYASWLNASATMTRENLFFTHNIQMQGPGFNCYSFSSKRYYSLASNGIGGFGDLLNCNDHVYFCNHENGTIWKYSAPLNRWFLEPIKESPKKCFYTSDGKLLYATDTEDMCVKFYDGRTKSWQFLTRLNEPYFLETSERLLRRPLVIDQNLYILSRYQTVMLDQRSQQWNEINNNRELGTPQYFNDFKKSGEKILYLCNESPSMSFRSAIYSFTPNDHSWNLEKSGVIWKQDFVPIHY